MRLSELLTNAEHPQLQRMEKELLHTDEPMPLHLLCSNLESALRSFPFVQGFLMNRQPPAFSMLAVLVDSPGFLLAQAVHRERTMSETERVCSLISEREILRRDDQLRLYRKVFFEARRSDMEIDSSEASLLSVLRRELGISQAEHFLLEHHPDFREFWYSAESFGYELAALLSTGLVFLQGEEIVLPEDLVGVVGQSLGIEMPTPSARRLLALLANSDLGQILEMIGAKTSGAKEGRIERLLANRVQPRTILDGIHIDSLKEICRNANAAVSGSKEEIIERIISHFGAGLDQVAASDVELQRLPEERILPEPRFRLLFASLGGRELSQILESFSDLRQSGSKDLRASTLWEAAISEEHLLSRLRSRDLENCLYRFDLGVSGAKPERIQRLVVHFAVTSIDRLLKPGGTDGSD